MEINELIVGGIGLLTTITSGWASWFFTRKKYNVEVEHNYIDNIEKGLGTYDAIIEHNKAEIEYLLEENKELRKEIAELRRQVLNLTMNICMDLTCTKRIRDNQLRMDIDGKIKDRFDETESSNRG